MKKNKADMPVCAYCMERKSVIMHSTTTAGTKRFRCLTCNKTFTEDTNKHKENIAKSVDLVLNYGYNYKKCCELFDLSEHLIKRGIICKHADFAEEVRKKIAENNSDAVLSEKMMTNSIINAIKAKILRER